MQHWKIVYLVQLAWLKMLILISINILYMVLDLIENEFFSHPSRGTGRNVIIFGVDMSSSTKIYNRKIYILILGKSPTQGLEHTLSAEKMYWINFTEINKNFVWACIIKEQIVIYLLMVKKFINLKQNILKL